ncbi:hypothetical protein ACFV3E_38695 [Streptomyces sp. NPDC059718]
MNLMDWAQAQGASPHTAYRSFRQGTLPVLAERLGPRTIPVRVEGNATPEAVSDIGLAKNRARKALEAAEHG